MLEKQRTPRNPLWTTAYASLYFPRYVAELVIAPSKCSGILRERLRTSPARQGRWGHQTMPDSLLTTTKTRQDGASADNAMPSYLLRMRTTRVDCS
ncbi:hypothetical protein CTRI78_v002974 [Colletotrichum trifolii]|uniref:Uncharacterized protein n=1 Tax=Colletotrichum trifolii TaxID=5466 RepID=A0A4R8RKM4_COLTR|nr:hypothetical protein CTRI78_v002974 [Colletotrichum trifolii]